MDLVLKVNFNLSSYIIYILLSQRPEESIGFLQTEVTSGCESMCGYWKLDSSHLEEQLVLLTSEMSLQPFKWIMMMGDDAPNSIYFSVLFVFEPRT